MRHKLLNTLFALLAFCACSKMTEPAPVEQNLRVVLSPELGTILANGRTADGQTEYEAVVKVYRGPSLAGDLSWSAEIVDEPSWIDDFQKSVVMESKFTDMYSGKDYTISENGIIISFRPNKGNSRTAVLRIKVSDGSVFDFRIRQRGEIPDDVHIDSVGDLRDWVADQSEWSDADCVYLDADIDMDGVEWEPINFSGKFDGQGHCIYNFAQTVSNRSYGFFGQMSGSVSNLVFGSRDGTTYDGNSIINFDGNGGKYHLGVISRCLGDVSNVSNFMHIKIASGCTANIYAAPLIGTVSAADITIKNCANHGDLSAPTADKTEAKETLYGGVLARCEPGVGASIDITGCKNFGSITSQDPFTTAIGGILGNVPNGHHVRIIGCENFGNVANNSTASPDGFKEGYAGGIGGLLYGNSDGILIKDCINHADLRASGTTLGDYGGILGRGRPALIEGCVNEGSITYEGTGKAQGLLIGGITGGMYNGGTVSDCINKGAILSNKSTVHRMGGITGTMSSGTCTVRGCTNEAPVSIVRTEPNGNWQGIGGICGYQENSDAAIIENCTNKGAILISSPSSTTHANAIGAGGIIGTCKLNMSLSGNVNEGDVTASISGEALNFAGGLAGYLYAGSVSGDKSRGAVSGATAGALAGNNCGTISGCAVAGSVNGTALNDGNIVSLAAGTNTGTISGTTLWK